MFYTTVNGTITINLNNISSITWGEGFARIFMNDNTGTKDFRVKDEDLRNLKNLVLKNSVK